MTTTRKNATTPRRAPRRAPAKAAEAQPLRDLWLAGLGAMATAGESANDFVDVLVRKGREREPRVRAAAARLVKNVQKNATGIASEAERRTREAVDGAFERLGVGSRPRQKNLLHRLGDLAEAIL
jgi:polyhydroxyalkanoate synthesis regulator phasin